jgi:hypothetical protein
LNGPGLRYEIGLNIRRGDIVWIHGGLPCGTWSDLKLARSAYIHEINEGELTIADDTYRDATYFIHPHAFPESIQLQSKIRARHETINRRFKQFKILDTKFRHKLYLHPRCFHAIAQVIQVALHNGHPLYQLEIE